MSPDDLKSWLRAFRRAVPRPERQLLIDTSDPEQFLLELARPAARGTKYPIALYLLSAKALQEPAALGTVDEREALLRRLGDLVGLPWKEVRRDVRAMMQLLQADHRRWCRRRERMAADRGDTAGVGGLE